MHGEAYKQSVDHRPRPRRPVRRSTQVNEDPFLRVIGKHRDASYRIPTQGVPANLIRHAHQVFDEALELGKQYGYRNAQVTVLAPTGTIAFMMDCDTTGVEPDIALIKYKKLVGEGFLKIVNQTVPAALKKLGYTAEQTSEILDYLTERETIEGAPHIKPEHLSVFDCAFKPANGTRSIHYMGHVRMMGAIQPFISRRDQQDREHAGGRDGRRDRAGLPRGLEARPQGDRDLPRQQQALAAAVDLEEEGQRLGRRHRRRRRRSRSSSPRPRPRRRFRIAGACRASGRRSPTSSTSPATRATSPSASTRMGSPGEIFLKMAKEGSTVSGLMDSFATTVVGGAPVRRAAQGPRQQVRPRPVRAERLHRQPGDPDRQVDRGLHLPVARVAVPLDRREGRPWAHRPIGDR